MKKKVLGLVLSTTMIAGLLTGCGSKASTTTEATTDAAAATETESTEEASETGDKATVRMTYWNSEDTMSAMLDYLKEAVPDVNVEFQFIDNSNYDTIVDTQLSAGEGPDIICESPASSLKHAKLGYLADLDELSTGYSNAGTSVYTYDEKVYALPGISWFEGIWYNKDVFEENNIALPKTFDEYIAVCKQFQDLGITPLAAGLKSWEPMLKNSMAFVTADYLSTAEGKNFGGDYREGNAKMDGTWNSYLEKWSEMITSGVYTTDMTGIDHDQALEQFAAGDAAMFCSGPWDLDAILEKNPDLNIDMMPFYGTQESDGWLIGGPGCGFAVNEASANKEAAMKVLAAISTVEGQSSLWENNQGGSSYFNGAAFDLPEAYDGVSGTLAAGNVYCPWNEWGAAAGVHETYGTEMQNYLLGTQDLSATLQNVDAATEELLSK
ncbi:MAG: extracellular solute-binding protein [Lachnospiraceae bacterium]|nr:extracellular solute-binding protein [Lachnospiraceae bacterium]